MGFLAKLFGIGAAAGATVAAVKVAQKYEENKNAQAAQTAAEAQANKAAANTDSSEFVEPDLQATPAGAVLDNVKKAAVDVYGEAAEKVKASVKTAAEKAGIDTEEVTDALAGAGKALANAGKAVAGKVQEEAPVAFEKAKVTAEKVFTQMKETVSDVAEAVRDKTDDIVIDITDAVESVTEPEEQADDAPIASEGAEDKDEAPKA